MTDREQIAEAVQTWRIEFQAGFGHESALIDALAALPCETCERLTATLESRAAEELKMLAEVEANARGDGMTQAAEIAANHSPSDHEEGGCALYHDCGGVVAAAIRAKKSGGSQ